MRWLKPASLLCLLACPLRASEPPSSVCLERKSLSDFGKGPIAAALGTKPAPSSHEKRCACERKCVLSNAPCRTACSVTPPNLAELWEPTPSDVGGLQFTFDPLSGTMPLRSGGTLLLDAPEGVGILAHVDYFGNQRAAPRYDERMLADVNATLTWARTEWVQMRTGVGVRWHMDGGHSDVGYNVHCGGDFLSLDPFTLSTSVDAGAIGDASFFRLRSTIDLVPNRLEAFGGYERMSIGRNGMRGPLIGVKLSY